MEFSDNSNFINLFDCLSRTGVQTYWDEFRYTDVPTCKWQLPPLLEMIYDQISVPKEPWNTLLRQLLSSTSNTVIYRKVLSRALFHGNNKAVKFIIQHWPWEELVVRSCPIAQYLSKSCLYSEEHINAQVTVQSLGEIFGRSLKKKKLMHLRCLDISDCVLEDLDIEELTIIPEAANGQTSPTGCSVDALNELLPNREELYAENCQEVEIDSIQHNDTVVSGVPMQESIANLQVCELENEIPLVSAGNQNVVDSGSSRRNHHHYFVKVNTVLLEHVTRFSSISTISVVVYERKKVRLTLVATAGHIQTDEVLYDLLDEQGAGALIADEAVSQYLGVNTMHFYCTGMMLRPAEGLPACKALAKKFPDSVITSLTLSDEYAIEEHLEDLLGCFQSGLLYLNTSRCEIGSVSLKIISNSIHISTLHTLILDNNNLSECGNELNELVIKLNQLQCLSLKGCKLNDSDLLRMIPILKENCLFLSVLNLLGNSFTAVSLIELPDLGILPHLTLILIRPANEDLAFRINDYRWRHSDAKFLRRIAITDSYFPSESSDDDDDDFEDYDDYFDGDDSYDSDSHYYEGFYNDEYMYNQFLYPGFGFYFEVDSD